MKLYSTLFIITLLVCFKTSVNAQTSESMYALFGNLEGTWVYTKGDKMIFEKWHFENDSTLSGKGFIVTGRDTVVTESVTLQKRDNIVKYIPVAHGQNNELPVEFTATFFNCTKETISGKQAHEQVLAIFGNPLHDSPKYIRYSITKGELTVLVGDDAAMSTNRMEFYFDKIE